MKEENNINILDELSKGCCMGSDAVKIILPKIDGKEFKEVASNLLEEYEDFLEKINKVYDKYIIDPNDNSCTSQLTNGQTEITLITCHYEKGNVHATKRFVVKAKAI